MSAEPALPTKKPTKKQIDAAREYIREHEFEIKVHAICQILGYTRKVREMEGQKMTEPTLPVSQPKEESDRIGASGVEAPGKPNR